VHLIPLTSLAGVEIFVLLPSFVGSLASLKIALSFSESNTGLASKSIFSCRQLGYCKQNFHLGLKAQDFKTIQTLFI
jgi:hypothetical protein